MIVSSVYFWLEQIRRKTEVYDCNALEQRKVPRDQVILRETTRERRWHSEEVPIGIEIISLQHGISTTPHLGEENNLQHEISNPVKNDLNYKLEAKIKLEQETLLLASVLRQNLRKNDICAKVTNCNREKCEKCNFDKFEENTMDEVEEENIDCKILKELENLEETINDIEEEQNLEEIKMKAKPIIAKKPEMSPEMKKMLSKNKPKIAPRLKKVDIEDKKLKKFDSNPEFITSEECFKSKLKKFASVSANHKYEDNFKPPNMNKIDSNQEIAPKIDTELSEESSNQKFYSVSEIDKFEENVKTFKLKKINSNPEFEAIEECFKPNLPTKVDSKSNEESVKLKLNKEIKKYHSVSEIDKFEDTTSLSETNKKKIVSCGNLSELNKKLTKKNDSDSDSVDDIEEHITSKIAYKLYSDFEDSDLEEEFEECARMNSQPEYMNIEEIRHLAKNEESEESLEIEEIDSDDENNFENKNLLINENNEEIGCIMESKPFKKKPIPQPRIRLQNEETVVLRRRDSSDQNYKKNRVLNCKMFEEFNKNLTEYNNLGKSLDSILDTINEEEDLDNVDLRPKRYSLGNIYDPDHRKALIPERKRTVSETRRTLETINEDRASGPYENIWEFKSPVKHGEMSRVSEMFNETVEEIDDLADVPIRYKVDMPDGVIYWLTELLTSYSSEEEGEMESLQRNEFESAHNAKKNRQTMDQASFHENQFDFENFNRIAVDGKLTKLNKNEKFKVKNGDLHIDDGKTCKKIVANLTTYTAEQKSPKRLELRGDKNVKVYFTENRTILQKFFRKRISQEDLQKKGIYKNESIFGNTLQLLHEKYGDPVPKFVQRIIELIEEPSNLKSPGIYRASGNLATMQKIRLEVDKNKLEILDEHRYDTDVLAGSLKMFFRELKEPLICGASFNKLIKIAESNSIKDDKFKSVGQIINNMPIAHKETLNALFDHLLKVTKHEEDNHMSIQNVSICWGPSMIFSEQTNMTEVLHLAQQKNLVLELLLHTYQATLVSNLKPSDSVMSSIAGSDSTIGYQRSTSVDSEICKPLDRCISMTDENKLLKDLVNRLENAKETLYAEKVTGKLVNKIMKKAYQDTSKTLPKLLDKAKPNQLAQVLFDYTAETMKRTAIIPREVFEDVLKNGDSARTNFLNCLPGLNPNSKLLLNHFTSAISWLNSGVTNQYNISKMWTNQIYDNPSKLNIECLFKILDFLKDTSSPSKQQHLLNHNSSRDSVYDNVPPEPVHLEKINEESNITCCAVDRPSSSTYNKSEKDISKVMSKSTSNLTQMGKFSEDKIPFSYLAGSIPKLKSKDEKKTPKLSIASSDRSSVRL